MWTRQRCWPRWPTWVAPREQCRRCARRAVVGAQPRPAGRASTRGLRHGHARRPRGGGVGGSRPVWSGARAPPEQPRRRARRTGPRGPGSGRGPDSQRRGAQPLLLVPARRPGRFRRNRGRAPSLEPGGARAVASRLGGGGCRRRGHRRLRWTRIPAGRPSRGPVARRPIGGGPGVTTDYAGTALDGPLAPLQVADRVARLRPGIESAGVDALLVTALPNVRYLTGFS